MLVNYASTVLVSSLPANVPSVLENGNSTV